MNQTRKSPVTAGLQTHTKSSSKSSTRPRLGKQARILLELFRDHRLHRFQAEHIGDHCLHSTISALSNTFGLTFARKWVEVPTRFGTQAKVMEYSLAASSREQAAQLLRRWGVEL